MNEFFNWHDFGIVISHNWIWLILAFLIGAFVAWRTCEQVPDQNS
jgi:hypothetical protein